MVHLWAQRTGGRRRLALVAVAALTMAACGGGDPEAGDEPDRTTTTTEPPRSTTTRPRPATTTTTTEPKATWWFDERFPLYADDTSVIVRAEGRDTITELDLDTGAELSTVDAPDPTFGGRIVPVGDDLLWVGSVEVVQPPSGLAGEVRHREVRAIDARSGEARWAYPARSADGDEATVLGTTSDGLILVSINHALGGSTFVSLDGEGRAVASVDQADSIQYDPGPLAHLDAQDHLPSPHSRFMLPLPDSGREVLLTDPATGGVALTHEPFDNCSIGAYTLFYGPGAQVAGCRFVPEDGTYHMEVVGPSGSWMAPTDSAFVHADAHRCQIVYLDPDGTQADRGTMVAADARTGEVRWEAPYTRQLELTLADEHHMYFGATQVSLEDGATTDTDTTDAHVFASAAIQLAEWTLFLLPPETNPDGFEMLVALPGNVSGSVIDVAAATSLEGLTAVPPPTEPAPCE